VLGSYFCTSIRGALRTMTEAGHGGAAGRAVIEANREFKNAGGKLAVYAEKRQKRALVSSQRIRRVGGVAQGN